MPWSARGFELNPAGPARSAAVAARAIADKQSEARSMPVMRCPYHPSNATTDQCSPPVARPSSTTDDALLRRVACARARVGGNYSPVENTLQNTLVVAKAQVGSKMTPAYHKDSGSTKNELIHMGEGDHTARCG
eukprot:COSAG02_NODE_1088_length_14670_cov_237.088326_3_plen_134_part_00